MYSKFSIDDAWRVFEKMPAKDLISWNTMMVGYFQHGRLVDGHCLFQGMPEKDVVSWTGIITGFAQNGYNEEALKLFFQMKQQGIKPNRSTFASLLSACSSIAAMEQGKQIHDHIVKTEYSSDVFVGNALVTMYSKCGSISIAY